ncbi:hypothetical protein UA08_03226 [Talaromyces atroroseus]|uniref:Uncharacterized protein n=1 Tax=Talaromyces atroroseus TaxID=1441469 RepID=A0A225B0W0_TALAT|nr:hypothetical protein UA08_03226 [Talaromyces atroroseus]OKL60896.1 hypothetical protein UA08_03226 [Talaromyces atroroseus]
MALCLICQGLLGYRFLQEQMFMDDIYTEDKKWVKFKRKRQVIFMEARDLEAKVFRNKNIDHWVSLYRLNLLEYREIKKLEFALGTFSVADSRYWRQRASRNLVEMDEVALFPDVDWRYLCMALERIQGGADFEARHRVLGILRDEIKPILLKNLKERNVPSLEEIVDQVREMDIPMWEDEF